MNTDVTLVSVIAAVLISRAVMIFWSGLSPLESALWILILIFSTAVLFAIAWEFLSKSARDRKKRVERVMELPLSLRTPDALSVYLGRDRDLELPVFLPDSIRARHVHILGATGSGKTESVILNFLKQDVSRGIGAIILDAKGDASFLRELHTWIPTDRLKVFDLGSAQSLGYDPLLAGDPLEAAQRLFSSLTWSEEYYKSKAFSVLQKLFENHAEKFGQNPTLLNLAHYLETQDQYVSAVETAVYPEKLAAKDFLEISGLRDQVRVLTTGYLKSILSPECESSIRLEDAAKGVVIYFRLQSLLSQALVGIVGKLVINHLSFLAGSAHRETKSASAPRFVPTYLDEFASFACPEFADLISKARSAGLALHFSHQSVGDLAEISPGFLSRITDNSATKIVLRINDPDSADLMSRAFGTALYQKVTQRVTNAKELDRAELVGEGSQREAHQFRASPDLLKTLPTGMGSVLIAHGFETPHGASSVFRVQFPRLRSAEVANAN